jgi:outer membrane protein TolC
VAPAVRIEDLVQTATQICKPIQTLDNRADVRAAAKSLDAAKQDRKTVDYTFAPTVDVAAQGGYFSFPFRSPSLDHWALYAGATATWVIFDGGDRYGQRRQKEAAEAIAREQLTQTERNAVLQTVQAERGILVARARLDVSTKTRDIAKEQARLSQIAFLNGSGTSLELVDSTSRLRAAELDVLTKEFGVFQAELAAFLAKAECSF